jgi:hypothetical protein
MKAGMLAAACAGLPLKFALAQNGTATSMAAQSGTPSPSFLNNINQLDYYTKAAFTPYVNTSFLVSLSASNTRSLTLTQVGDYLPALTWADAAASSLGTECFSLLFTLPPGRPFDQDTYMIEHAALGNFYMFLVPISPHDKKDLDYYEAVIYRRQEMGMAANPVMDSQTATSPAVATSQTASGPWRVKDENGVEREIYNFSSLTPPVKEPEKPAPVQATWLSMAQDQGISGIKLGMTVDQVLAFFPGSRDDEQVKSDLSQPASKLGISSLRLSPQKYSSKAEFKGIDQIMLTLLDGRVSTLYVGYTPQEEQVDEFVAKFSKGRKLPPAENWEPYAGLDNQLKTMKCKDFEISVFAGSKNVAVNYVQLVDTVAQQKLKARRLAARKKLGRSKS